MKEVTRDDVIGRRIVRAFASKWLEDEGFAYSEAVIELDNGIVFAVNSAGVDEPAPLVSVEKTNGMGSHDVEMHDVAGQVVTGIIV
ncbi:MAG: hypothetical protein O3B13_15335, partial [Planctomycetota bacterium]|nr:hypothetical protein [Planctomycetota bacterium]